MTDIANDNQARSDWSPRVVHQAPEDLKPAPRNARTHREKQIEQIMGSIHQFGFTSPVLVDGSNRIDAGHGRAEAARRLGRKSIPTIAPPSVRRGTAGLCACR